MWQGHRPCYAGPDRVLLSCSGKSLSLRLLCLPDTHSQPRPSAASVAVAVAGALSGEAVGCSPASGSRHRKAQMLSQHFLLSAHWLFLEHSLLSKQGWGISGACTRGQRPALCTGAGERRLAHQAPGPPCGWSPLRLVSWLPAPPHPLPLGRGLRPLPWGAGPGQCWEEAAEPQRPGRQGNGLTAGWSLGGWGAGHQEGCGVPTQGGPWTELAPPSPRQALAWGIGAVVLLMRGTTQERLQGLLGQHLVPWGQFSSELQETTQTSSSEELSSGHTACPAHRTGRWVGGWGGWWTASPGAGRWGGKQGGETAGTMGSLVPSTLTRTLS